jgi:neutral ceramidase
MPSLFKGMIHRNIVPFCIIFLLHGTGAFTQNLPSRIFKVGVATSNITPKIGTSINGNFQDASTQNIHDETHARSIVLDDGQQRLALVVADLCMVSREVLDAAKHRAHQFTSIPVANMMMSATHTHSGGTACSVFQSDPDAEYLKFLTERIADAVIRANAHLTPARIGWGVGHEPNQVFNRRWKMKAGTKLTNPFGKQDQVKMNPGIGNPDLGAPAGPTDPELPIVAIQTLDGKPLAILANYSLHYVGGTKPNEISADYYGLFAKKLTKLLGADEESSEFLAIMSNGTSGNINNIDFGGSAPQPMLPYEKMNVVATALATEACKVYQQIQYQDWVSLGSAQKELYLGVRKPTQDELLLAKEIVAKAPGAVMHTVEELYARETLLMRQVPLIIQAFRIGELAIAAVPCEVFVEIGLDLKKRSPFKPTFTISLANGYNGYLPTPEQHALGGYETWRARSSYLETHASTQITSVLFELFNALKSNVP